MEEEVKRPLQVLELHIEREQKYLSYLMNVDAYDCVNVESDWFLNTELKVIYESIFSIVNDELKVEPDIVYDRAKLIIPHFKFEQLLLIKNSFDNFDNIGDVKKGLKEQYIKQVVQKNIVSEVLEKVSSNNDLRIDELKGLHNNLGKSINDLEKSNYLQSYGDLIIKYKCELEKRKNGEKKRSIGFPELDKFLTYVGEPGDMLTFVMMKGHGKTTFALNAIPYLLNSGICVVNFAMDMGETTMMDRTISHKDSIKSRELVDYDLDREQQGKLRKSLHELSLVDNYFHVSDTGLSLSDIDAIYYEAKDKFREKNVLPKDGYFYTIKDTLDMVKDFSISESPYHIKACINTYHGMLRKHGIFSMNLVQSNENQIRKRGIKTPEAAENIIIGLADIEGGASYGSRSRVVMSGNRPQQMKMMLFPGHEDTELWQMEDDIYNISVVKQNDGKLGNFEYVLNKNNFRMEKFLKE